MILKPRIIARKLGNKWVRSWFVRKNCGVCNNESCFRPILLNSHTIGQFQDICLYTQSGNKFIVYLFDGDL